MPSYPQAPPGWTAVHRRHGRAVHHPRHLPARRRRHDGVALARAPQGRLAALTRRGATGWWAPRRASWWIAVLFIIGSACFAIGPFPGFVQLVGAGCRRRGLLRGLALLHHRGRAPVPGGGQRRPRPGAPRRAPAAARARVRAASHRLVGDDDPARGHGVLQHQHVRRPQHEPLDRAGGPADLGARRVRVRLLPDRQRARVGGGLRREGPRRPATASTRGSGRSTWAGRWPSRSRAWRRTSSRHGRHPQPRSGQLSRP